MLVTFLVILVIFLLLLITYQHIGIKVLKQYVIKECEYRSKARFINRILLDKLKNASSLLFITTIDIRMAYYTDKTEIVYELDKLQRSLTNDTKEIEKAIRRNNGHVFYNSNHIITDFSFDNDY